MLKKLFGRNKQQQNQEKKNRNKDSPPQTYASTPISAVEQETTSNEEKQVELATFSAQFPPPEWQWYESQHRQEQFPASSHPPHIGKQILAGSSLQCVISNLKSSGKVWLYKSHFMGLYRLLTRYERGIIHRSAVRAPKF